MNFENCILFIYILKHLLKDIYLKGNGVVYPILTISPYTIDNLQDTLHPAKKECNLSQQLERES